MMWTANWEEEKVEEITEDSMPVEERPMMMLSSGVIRLE
jgi:hypothetical protein